MSLLEEHSNPFVGRVRPHKERMSAISLVSRWNTNIVGWWIVEIPHWVDSVIIEERLLRALTQSHNSFIISILVSRISFHSYPIKIRIIDDIVYLEVGRCLSLLLGELNREGVSLNDHMAANLIRTTSSSRGVDDYIWNLELLSFFSLILRPCPSHIYNTLIEDSQRDVKVRECSNFVDESHADFGFFESLSKCSVIIENGVKYILKVFPAAQI